MLYVIAVANMEYTNDKYNYLFYESSTESFFSGGKKFLKSLLDQNRIHTEHTKLLDIEKSEKVWFNDICRISDGKITEPGSILVCQLGEDKYKLVSYSRSITTVNKDDLTDLVKDKRIANCIISNGKIKTVGTYSADKDDIFKDHISKLYTKYLTLTAMLGCKTTFTYEIEAKEVKLAKCIDTTRKVIIPNFITSIMRLAFNNRGIEELSLNTGLKAIGSNAFLNNNISNVTIPETTEFMSLDIFRGNKRLVNSSDDYTENIKILNSKAIILNKQDNDLY